MENMNLQKFNFDFELTYKKLINEANRMGNDKKGSYHYLETSDRFHDVIEKTIKFFKDADIVEYVYFKSIFWNNWKFNKLASYDKSGIKTTEGSRTVYNVESNSLITYQPDLDQKELINKIRTLPTVSKLMEGYSAIEVSKELGISRHTFYQRYHKELKKIMV